MIFLQLFLVFIQIGIFGFGGGYSMISLIQGQVVTQYHWMTMQEFTDVVAISQMTPGPIGINAATYCGYTAVHNAGLSESMAILGSAVATFALVLPSLILMILISKMLYKLCCVPPVVCDLTNVVLIPQPQDGLLDIVVIDHIPLRHLDESLLCPQIIVDMVAAGVLCDRLLRHPGEGKDNILTIRGDGREDQHESSQVLRGG